MLRLCVVLFLLITQCPLGVHAEPVAHTQRSVGFHRLHFEDPVDQQSMNAIVFYPSLGPKTSSRMGVYDIEATADAKIAMGHYPMLVLSHGNVGTPLAQHDLITALARKGFVVVAVLHPGDNVKDHSRTGTLSNLYGRPMQISAAISAVLGDNSLSPYIDADQVGIIGYSAGGETALILAGAQPDLDRLRRYCQERPSDRDACSTQGELLADRDDLRPEADSRVRALLLMAPLSLMFGRETLSQVQVPVLLYSGDGDQTVFADKNAEALARKLPLVPQFNLIPGAGHFVFMAPCTDEQRATMAWACTDANGVDREDIHRDLIYESGRFFNKVLNNHSHTMLRTADY